MNQIQKIVSKIFKSYPNICWMELTFHHGSIIVEDYQLQDSDLDSTIDYLNDEFITLLKTLTDSLNYNRHFIKQFDILDVKKMLNKSLLRINEVYNKHKPEIILSDDIYQKNYLKDLNYKNLDYLRIVGTKDDLSIYVHYFADECKKVSLKDLKYKK